MSTVIERIELLRETLGFKQKKAFSTKIGVNHKTYTHFTNKKYEHTKFDYSVLVKIVETFPETNSKWLLTGEGRMFLGEQLHPDPKKIIQPKDKELDLLNSIIIDKNKIIQLLESENQQLKKKNEQLELENKKLQS
ncbi:MAG: hypothetical protein ACI86H_000612 [bacterium]|jgi:hypothetical protein